MPEELEIKLRLRDVPGLQRRLRDAHAVRVGSGTEVNWILDADDGRLRDAGCGLRVRTAMPTDSAQERRVTLTFKGPRSSHELKQREELETEVGDAGPILAILDRLGFTPRVAYEKRRETWELDECEVVIDEMPELGHFVEIEGTSPAVIGRMRQRLGLNNEPVVQETYVELAAQHGARDRSGCLWLRF